MSSIRSAAMAAGLLLAGCELDAPPVPPPLDCERVDRASERFPTLCDGAVEGDEDAGADDDAAVDVDAGDDGGP